MVELTPARRDYSAPRRRETVACNLRMPATASSTAKICEPVKRVHSVNFAEIIIARARWDHEFSFSTTVSTVRKGLFTLSCLQVAV